MGELRTPDGSGPVSSNLVVRFAGRIPESQLAWAAPDRLYRADPGGAVLASGDGGVSWAEVGSLDTLVNELAADADGALYAAVPGGEVRRSVDGGATWALAVKLR